MRFIIFALAALGLGAPGNANPTGPVGDIRGLMRADDYPPEAVERGEQGTTQVRLLIGINGRVKRCGVAVSSGSKSLDAKTCEVLIERAQLKPATDAKGKPVEGTVQQRITWRLSEGPEDMVVAVAVAAWKSCIFNSAVPQIGGTETPEIIAELAQATCKPLEAGIEAAAKASKLPGVSFPDIMKYYREASVVQIRQWREEARAATQAPTDKT